MAYEPRGANPLMDAFRDRKAERGTAGTMGNGPSNGLYNGLSTAAETPAGRQTDLFQLLMERTQPMQDKALMARGANPTPTVPRGPVGANSNAFQSNRVPPAWERFQTANAMQDAYRNNWQPNPILLSILGKQ